MDSRAAYLSSRLPALEGGGGRKGAVPKPSTLGLVFITATGFLGWADGAALLVGAAAAAGVVRVKGSIESVWKLMGAVGAILSICWMPAWK